MNALHVNNRNNPGGLGAEPSPEKKQMSNYIKGVFLLLLAIFGNFLAVTLSCPLQQYLSNNTLAKQIIIFGLIFFSVDITSYENANPTSKLFQTVMIWIGFLILTKLDLEYSLTLFILLGVIYLLQSYIEFYKDNTSLQNKLILIQNVLEIFTGIVLLFGLYKYLQKKQGSIKFDTLLQIEKCDFKN